MRFNKQFTTSEGQFKNFFWLQYWPFSYKKSKKSGKNTAQILRNQVEAIYNTFNINETEGVFQELNVI